MSSVKGSGVDSSEIKKIKDKQTKILQIIEDMRIKINEGQKIESMSLGDETPTPMNNHVEEEQDYDMEMSEHEKQELTPAIEQSDEEETKTPIENVKVNDEEVEDADQGTENMA